MKHHPDIIEPLGNRNGEPLIRRTNTDKDHPNVIVEGPHYRVSGDISRVPLDEYCDNGFETRKEFRESVGLLISRWQGREGECIEERLYPRKDGNGYDERNRLLHLNFHDIPGRAPETAWIPAYLADTLTATAAPSRSSHGAGGRFLIEFAKRLLGR